MKNLQIDLLFSLLCNYPFFWKHCISFGSQSRVTYDHPPSDIFEPDTMQSQSRFIKSSGIQIKIFEWRHTQVRRNRFRSIRVGNLTIGRTTIMPLFHGHLKSEKYADIGKGPLLQVYGPLVWPTWSYIWCNWKPRWRTLFIPQEKEKRNERK